ncbi:YwqG family protein [Amycolatopsis aidingensis]|uniref:YwqG family protein n=1 Tax=Amycolatopsis aidingensis TaxID=2842453 RepID=UPI001C0AB55C|nr:YwqG family protein [Amycolatopsis aidingensis]
MPATNADRTPAPLDARLDDTAIAELLAGLPADLAATTAERARPAIRFATRRCGPDSAPGASRFGGDPDLPADLAWPTWVNPLDKGGEPRPLGFFAQIDLATVAGGTDLPLPSDGLLSFFCDFATGGGHGGILGLYQHEHEGCRVRHLPATTPARRAAPPAAHSVPEALLLPILVTTFPEPDPATWTDGDHDEGYAGWDEVERRYERLLAAAVPEGWALAGRHQLGGHARSIQHPVEEEVLQAAAGVSRAGRAFDHERWAAIRHRVADWRLLLQLDSDSHLGYLWGDAGTLYWMARQDSIAAADWSAAWFNFQCS